MDLPGLSLVIGSIAVLVTSVTAAVVSIATFIMQVRSKADRGEIKSGLAAVAKDVVEAKENIKIVELATNSLTDRLVESTRKASHAAGVKEEKERASSLGESR